VAKIRIKTDRDNKRLILGLWVMICIAAKFIQLKFLPEKYFIDGVRIFLESTSGYRSGDRGYDTASNFFSVANKIFHINSYNSWAVFLGIIGSVILIYFIQDSLQELFFWDFAVLSCSLFLMNIYTFNVSKEIIQILIMIPLISVLNFGYKTKTKIIVCMASLLLIGYFLRSYFILIAVIFVVIYKVFLSSFYQEKKKFWRNICFVFCIGVIGLFILKTSFPDLYDSLSQARISLNQNRIGSDDANTMIVNVIEDDGSIFTYTLNIIINIFRLLFPVTVAAEGMSQLLFFIYQIILSGKLLVLFYNMSEENLNESTFIAISLLIAYFIVAAIFEPDYGSVIKHEMAVFPIMYIALIRRGDHVKTE